MRSKTSVPGIHTSLALPMKWQQKNHLILVLVLVLLLIGDSIFEAFLLVARKEKQYYVIFKSSSSTTTTIIIYIIRSSNSTILVFRCQYFASSAINTQENGFYLLQIYWIDIVCWRQMAAYDMASWGAYEWNSIYEQQKLNWTLARNTHTHAKKENTLKCCWWWFMFTIIENMPRTFHKNVDHNDCDNKLAR